MHVRNMCCNFGWVKDAFVPKKMEKRGGRFGFVRFRTIKKGNATIKALNGGGMYFLLNSWTRGI